MKYIKIDKFDDTLIFKSPTYGNYKIRKIAEVDYITAFKNKELKIALDEYSNLKSKLGMVKTKKLDTLKLNDVQSLSKFDVYTALLEDNFDWEDPKGNMKRLPVAIKTKTIYKS